MATRRLSRTASSCRNGSLRSLWLTSAVLTAALVSCSGSDTAHQKTTFAAPTAAARLRVNVVNSVASVQARDVPLEAVLAELAQRSGLRLVAYAPLTELVTDGFERLPLPDAVRRLLGHRAYLLIPPTLYVFAADPSSHQPTAVPAANPFDLAQRLETLSAMPASETASIAALAEAAGTDSAASMREAAIVALGDLHAPDPAGAARRAAALQRGLGDADVTVQLATIRALAEVGDSPSVQALSTVLHSADDRLRAEAVDALGTIDDPGAMLLLEQALSDPRAPVREAASEWLAERAAQ